MDGLDFVVLGALHDAPRQTYDELGRRVGLSANAVKERVRRLQESGVLQGFAALPRPDLLGLREGLLLFEGVDDLDAREEEILRGLAEVPGVRFTDAGLDHTVFVWLLHRDDADWERIERACVSLVGKPPSRAARASPASTPTAALAPSDVPVVRALQPDGRAHAKELTARAGLSAKPLKKRLERLLRAGDVRVVPIVSPAEASGTVLFRVVCFLAPGAAVPAVKDAILTLEAPGVVSILAQRATVREARAFQRALSAAPGVERALLQLATRRASLAWMDDLLARLGPKSIRHAAPVPMPVPRSR